MKNIIKGIVKKIIGIIGHLVPMQNNLMLFESHDDFTDNSYAFYEFIKNHHPEIKCVWIISKKNQEQAQKRGIQYILCNKTLKMIWFKYRAKYFLYSYRNFNYFPLKNGQIHINLWHGTPLKMFNGKTISNIDKAEYYFLAPNNRVFEIFKRIAPMNNNVIYCGYPRLDYFNPKFSPEQTIASSKLMDSLDSEKYKKTILMMPTFRFDKRSSQDFFEQFPFPLTEETFKYLNDRLFEDEVMLIIKLHHMQNKVDISEFQSKYSNIKFIKNIDLVNEGVQLYSFVACSDALITDYSSISFDYMVLDKPIGYLINDFESYAQNEGFVFDKPLDYMPGQKFTDLEGMIEFIHSVVENKDEYRNERHLISDEVNDEITLYSEKLWRLINTSK